MDASLVTVQIVVRASQCESCHVHATYVYGGFYVACKHVKHGNAKRYNLWCNFVLGGETKLHPKPYRLPKQTLTIYFHYMSKVETPYNKTTMHTYMYKYIHHQSRSYVMSILRHFARIACIIMIIIDCDPQPIPHPRPTRRPPNEKHVLAPYGLLNIETATGLFITDSQAQPFAKLQPEQMHLPLVKYSCTCLNHM